MPNFSHPPAISMFSRGRARLRKPNGGAGLLLKEFAPVGFARNDIFFREANEQDLIGVDRQSLSLVQEARRDGKSVIVYGPTFRDHKGPDWFEQSGIIPFAERCGAQGHLFLINLHPFEQKVVEELRQLHPALKFIAPHTDIYPVVKFANVFITDYSSLAFDLLHIDCPLVSSGPIMRNTWRMRVRSSPAAKPMRPAKW